MILKRRLKEKKSKKSDFLHASPLNAVTAPIGGFSRDNERIADNG
jgi:hypothetical protein